ncbi:interferon a3-like [Boleophthalmus pectinirostris]|uniref:interferon a3-like n=1 Tax=Boleophthalmus pectinirostris TaxID=150288 RepID=UPI00242E5177|nr:interferon a3-like [Boleophthalmus pectinirostris]
MMMFRMILLCALVGAGSALSCRWIEHNYGDYRDNSLVLLSAVGNNSISSFNSTEDADLQDTVAFPNELYNHASNAITEERLRFMAQLLDEIVSLFEEDQSAASWHESAVDDFLNVITQQADGLRSCVTNQSSKRKNKKLSLYFKRLSTLLEQMGHNAEAWEWIRREVKLHLQRADLLIPAKTN